MTPTTATFAIRKVEQHCKFVASRPKNIRTTFRKSLTLILSSSCAVRSELKMSFPPFPLAAQNFPSNYQIKTLQTCARASDAPKASVLNNLHKIPKTTSTLLVRKSLVFIFLHLPVHLQQRREKTNRRHVTKPKIIRAFYISCDLFVRCIPVHYIAHYPNL